jgi:hypothetical protein
MHRTAAKLFPSAIQEYHPLLAVRHHYWIGPGAKKPRKIPEIHLGVGGDICPVNGCTGVNILIQAHILGLFAKAKDYRTPGYLSGKQGRRRLERARRLFKNVQTYYSGSRYLLQKETDLYNCWWFPHQPFSSPISCPEQVAEKVSEYVILRSCRRRRISQGVNLTDAEILRFAQNDTASEFFSSLLTGIGSIPPRSRSEQRSPCQFWLAFNHFILQSILPYNM